MRSASRTTCSTNAIMARSRASRGTPGASFMIAVTVGASNTLLASTLPCASEQYELRSARAAASVASSYVRTGRFDWIDVKSAAQPCITPGLRLNACAQLGTNPNRPCTSSYMSRTGPSASDGGIVRMNAIGLSSYGKATVSLDGRRRQARALFDRDERVTDGAQLALQRGATAALGHTALGNPIAIGLDAALGGAAVPD